MDVVPPDAAPEVLELYRRLDAGELDLWQDEEGHYRWHDHEGRVVHCESGGPLVKEAPDEEQPDEQEGSE